MGFLGQCVWRACVAVAVSVVVGPFICVDVCTSACVYACVPSMSACLSVCVCVCASGALTSFSSGEDGPCLIREERLRERQEDSQTDRKVEGGKNQRTWRKRERKTGSS